IGVVGGERRESGNVWCANVAHPDRKLGEFCAVFGKHVRLQVEHDLQAMLEFTEETVVVFEDRAFLVREAARLLQAGDGVERVAGTDFGEHTAIEQLKKLDDELDIANAAAARFHVAQVATCAFGAALDSTLERLNARDIGETQVAT